MAFRRILKMSCVQYFCVFGILKPAGSSHAGLYVCQCVTGGPCLWMERVCRLRLPASCTQAQSMPVHNLVLSSVLPSRVCLLALVSFCTHITQLLGLLYARLLLLLHVSPVAHGAGMPGCCCACCCLRPQIPSCACGLNAAPQTARCHS